MNELLHQVFKANRNILIIATATLTYAIIQNKRIQTLERKIEELKNQKGD